MIGKPRNDQLGYYAYINEMGRDSLRVILECLPVRYLVPDHFCPTIIETMDAMGAYYKFYHINEDFSIDWSTVDEKDYDVFYYINHGKGKIRVPLDKILLEDNVFHKDFEPYHPQYIGYNSWRKCTGLICGSMIKSTIQLKDTYWQLPKDQLALLLRTKRTIFVTYRVKDRDTVQNQLSHLGIYLPVFWRGSNNKLSEEVISIPVDSRYTHKQIKEVEKILCKYQL